MGFTGAAPTINDLILRWKERIKKNGRREGTSSVEEAFSAAGERRESRIPLGQIHCAHRHLSLLCRCFGTHLARASKSGCWLADVRRRRQGGAYPRTESCGI